MATEREIRRALARAIQKQDQEAARTTISYCMEEDLPLENMTDLHYSLMLLLAAPKNETRGRKKKTAQENDIWHLNMACKIRARIDEKTFSHTWGKHCNKTRPTQTTDDVVTCASILQVLIELRSKSAKAAAKNFNLRNEDLDALLLPNAVKK
jgi:hypothetical protein